MLIVPAGLRVPTTSVLLQGRLGAQAEHRVWLVGRCVPVGVVRLGAVQPSPLDPLRLLDVTKANVEEVLVDVCIGVV